MINFMKYYHFKYSNDKNNMNLFFYLITSLILWLSYHAWLLLHHDWLHHSRLSHHTRLLHWHWHHTRLLHWHHTRLLHLHRNHSLRCHRGNSLLRFCSFNSCYFTRFTFFVTTFHEEENDCTNAN